MEILEITMSYYIDNGWLLGLNIQIYIYSNQFPHPSITNTIYILEKK